MRKKRNLSGDDMFSIVGKFIEDGFGPHFSSYEDRLVKNTKGEFGIVDTVMAEDTGFYETAVVNEQFNNGNWIIVEQYETRELAMKGHNKWVKKLKAYPKSLTDIFSEETFTRQV